jgi:hypothetical protein
MPWRIVVLRVRQVHQHVLQVNSTQSTQQSSKKNILLLWIYNNLQVFIWFHIRILIYKYNEYLATKLIWSESGIKMNLTFFQLFSIYSQFILTISHCISRSFTKSRSASGKLLETWTVLSGFAYFQRVLGSLNRLNILNCKKSSHWK